MLLIADAIQLKYEVFFVLVMAIVLATTRTTTAIGSNRYIRQQDLYGFAMNWDGD